MNEGPTIFCPMRSATRTVAGSSVRVVRHRICEFVY